MINHVPEEVASQAVTKLFLTVRLSIINQDSVLDYHTHFWVPVSQHAAIIDVGYWAKMLVRLVASKVARATW